MGPHSSRFQLTQSKSKEIRNWFGQDFVEVYLKHNEAELDYLKSMTNEEKCAAYQKVY